MAGDARSRSRVGRWLLLANLALGCYSVGTVWLVQLSSYRLWAHVAPNDFQNYHRVWWQSIWGPVLFPAALAFAGAMAMFWIRPPGVPSWAAWLGVVLQIAWVLGTVVWWAPLMMRIGESSGEFPVPLFRLLLSTHWLRVALISAYGVLVFGMAIVSTGERADGATDFLTGARKDLA
jgi:hypothetical protein